MKLRKKLLPVKQREGRSTRALEKQVSHDKTAEVEDVPKKNKNERIKNLKDGQLFARKQKNTEVRSMKKPTELIDSIDSEKGIQKKSKRKRHISVAYISSDESSTDADVQNKSTVSVSGKNWKKAKKMVKASSVVLLPVNPNIVPLEKVSVESKRNSVESSSNDEEDSSPHLKNKQSEGKGKNNSLPVFKKLLHSRLSKDLSISQPNSNLNNKFVSKNHISRTKLNKAKSLLRCKRLTIVSSSTGTPSSASCASSRASSRSSSAVAIETSSEVTSRCSSTSSVRGMSPRKLRCSRPSKGSYRLSRIFSDESDDEDSEPEMISNFRSSKGNRFSCRTTGRSRIWRKPANMRYSFRPCASQENSRNSKTIKVLESSSDEDDIPLSTLLTMEKIEKEAKSTTPIKSLRNNTSPVPKKKVLNRPKSTREIAASRIMKAKNTLLRKKATSSILKRISSTLKTPTKTFKKNRRNCNLQAPNKALAESEGTDELENSDDRNIHPSSETTMNKPKRRSAILAGQLSKSVFKEELKVLESTNKNEIDMSDKIPYSLNVKKSSSSVKSSEVSSDVATRDAKATEKQLSVTAVKSLCEKKKRIKTEAEDEVSTPELDASEFECTPIGKLIENRKVKVSHSTKNQSDQLSNKINRLEKKIEPKQQSKPKTLKKKVASKKNNKTNASLTDQNSEQLPMILAKNNSKETEVNKGIENNFNNSQLEVHSQTKTSQSVGTELSPKKYKDCSSLKSINESIPESEISINKGSQVVSKTVKGKTGKPKLLTKRNLKAKNTSNNSKSRQVGSRDSQAAAKKKMKKGKTSVDHAERSVGSGAPETEAKKGEADHVSLQEPLVPAIKEKLPQVPQEGSKVESKLSIPAKMSKSRRKNRLYKFTDDPNSTEFRCRECGLQFDSYESYKSHDQDDCANILYGMSIMVEEDQSFECPHCHLTFAYMTTQKKHSNSCRSGRSKSKASKVTGSSPPNNEISCSSEGKVINPAQDKKEEAGRQLPLNKRKLNNVPAQSINIPLKKRKLMVKSSAQGEADSVKKKTKVIAAKPKRKSLDQAIQRIKSKSDKFKGLYSKKKLSSSERVLDVSGSQKSSKSTCRDSINTSESENLLQKSPSKKTCVSKELQTTTKLVKRKRRNSAGTHHSDNSGSPETSELVITKVMSICDDKSLSTLEAMLPKKQRRHSFNCPSTSDYSSSNISIELSKTSEKDITATKGKTTKGVAKRKKMPSGKSSLCKQVSKRRKSDVPDPKAVPIDLPTTSKENNVGTNIEEEDGPLDLSINSDSSPRMSRKTSTILSEKEVCRSLQDQPGPSSKADTPPSMAGVNIPPINFFPNSLAVTSSTSEDSVHGQLEVTAALWRLGTALQNNCISAPSLLEVTSLMLQYRLSPNQVRDVLNSLVVPAELAREKEKVVAQCPELLLRIPQPAGAEEVFPGSVPGMTWCSLLQEIINQSHLQMMHSMLIKVARSQKDSEVLYSQPIPNPENLGQLESSSVVRIVPMYSNKEEVLKGLSSLEIMIKEVGTLKVTQSRQQMLSTMKKTFESSAL